VRRGRSLKSRSPLERVSFVINLLFCLHIFSCCRDRKEHRVFQKLLRMVPHLPERLMEVSNEECMVIAELVRLFSPNLYIFSHPSKIQKGISSARSDDTKSLKGVVLEWISPPNIPVQPPLSRNVKTNRGYHHPATGALLCPAGLDWNDTESVFLLLRMLLMPLIPTFRVREKLSSGEMPVRGDQWPMLVYADQEYDPQEPWEGLFRSRILVWVRMRFYSPSAIDSAAYRHLSTSSPHPVQWRKR
jgi:hypothetical protein